jgi:hypothetical protein
MEEDPEWVMAPDWDIVVTGVECTVVDIATVAVTMEAVCTTDLTLGHLDTGVSLAKKK